MPTSQIYQSEPVVLTDAQVKALPTTGIQIVPAPGAGKALSFVAGLAVAHKVAGYTNVDQYANIIYLQNPTGSLFFAMGEWSNVFLENAEDRYMPFAQYATPDGNNPPLALLTGSTLLAAVENQPMHLKLANDLGDLTGGNAGNTLTVTVYYTIIDV